MNGSRLSARDLAFMQRYPVVFGCGPRQVGRTSLARGLAIGDGWLPLLDQLCTGLSQVIADDGLSEFRTLQVKEKFGGLRFCVTGGNVRARVLIEAAERESLRTCEGCGGPSLRHDLAGWITTLCNSCLDRKRAILERDDP